MTNKKSIDELYTIISYKIFENAQRRISSYRLVY